METERQLIEKIMKITSLIKDKYPERYASLGEMPVTIPNTKHPDMNIMAFKAYYESLVYAFDSYEKTHKK